MNNTDHKFHATVFSSFYPARRSRILSARQSTFRSSPSLAVFIFYTQIFSGGVRMCRLEVGYFLVRREIRRSLAGDAIARDLYFTLMDWAVIAQTDFHGTTVHRGNLITGFNDLATELGISVKTARRKLRQLCERGFITKTRIGNTAGIKIAVLNYDVLQRPQTGSLSVLPKASSPHHGGSHQTLEPQGFHGARVLSNASSPHHGVPIINELKELKELKEEREVLITKPYYLKPRQSEVPPPAVESPPSFLNQFQNQESGSKIETAHISENDRNVSPIDSNQEDIETCETNTNIDLNTQPAIPRQTD